MEKKDLVMKPPLNAIEMKARLESDLMWARTAPFWVPTMRHGDGAYKFAEMQLESLKEQMRYA